MNPPRRRTSQPPTNLQMSDIARLAGVSESTVSRALKDSPLIAASTRERIRRLAEEAGYVVNPVASSLRSRQSGVITVAVPLVHAREPHLFDPFMMTMLAHLADALGDRGYNMLLAKIAVHQDGWVRRLQQPGRSDGVILIGQSSEHAAINEAARTGIPLTAWGTRMPAQKYPVVGTDNRLGGQLGTEHLIRHGRRRIAFLGDERLPEVAHRHDGYRQALRAAGLKAHPDLLVRSPFSSGDAYASVRALIDGGADFDGVMAASDVIAISAIRAITESGRRVPQDVSVVGFDDILLAEHAHPPLTTVRQELAQGAVKLVDTVIAAIRGEQAESTILPPTLIVRASA
ncbi:LacI family DNA-binding transcriptional regulator [Lysobacter hankyongensis]|uniref:LacI family DNA-binding transcriptional regulator n=1 Tax=Lysobacter hankyongensis TaxID=1176535 RepID=A0ABP9BFM8_9GAMM